MLRNPSRRPVERLQLPDHALDHAQSTLPEARLPGIEAERRQQLGMMLRAAGGEHREVALREALVRFLVDRIERVDQAIAECVGVNVERRMDEVADIGPEGLVTGLELDRRPEALALHAHPERAKLVGGEFALAPRGVDLALEGIERDL